MASVVNLGQFGPRRESVLAPVRRGLKAGSEAYMKGVTDAATLKTALAESTRKQTEVNRKNANKTLDDLSAYMSSKTPAEQEAFKQTDIYKNSANIIKKYLPEYYDKDTKSIMLRSTKDMYTAKLEQHRSDIADKIARGEQLSPTDLKLKDFLDKVDVRVAATAIDMASKDRMWQFWSETEKATAVQDAMKLLQKTRGNIYTNELAEEPMGDEADPLGILR